MKLNKLYKFLKGIFNSQKHEKLIELNYKLKLMETQKFALSYSLQELKREHEGYVIAHKGLIEDYIALRKQIKEKRSFKDVSVILTKTIEEINKLDK